MRERATYDVAVAYDADKTSEGGTFQVAVGGKSFPGKVAPTPKNPVRVGRVTLEPGAHELVVSATKIAGGELFRLRDAQLHFVQRGPSPSFDGLAANWGYQDCDQKTIQYPYPDDPGDGFPPGSCPPPANLKIECAGGSKIKVAAADASTWEKGFAHPPQYAFDDHLASRWSSHYTDDQWLTLDLGRAAIVPAPVPDLGAGPRRRLRHLDLDRRQALDHRAHRTRQRRLRRRPGRRRAAAAT